MQISINYEKKKKEYGVSQSGWATCGFAHIWEQLLIGKFSEFTAWLKGVFRAYE